MIPAAYACIIEVTVVDTISITGAAIMIPVAVLFIADIPIINNLLT